MCRVLSRDQKGCKRGERCDMVPALQKLGVRAVCEEEKTHLRTFKRKYTLLCD